MENYIMLDGQKFELDNALVGKLRATINNQKLENEKERNPFERQKKELAMKAIDEIIKPFMAKHLDFTL